MRLFRSMLVLCFLNLIVLSCPLCVVAAEEKKPEQTQAEAPNEPPNIVAKIGEYVITRQELQERLLQKLRPGPYEYSGEATPPDPRTVLMEMLAEKAMVIEAREQGYLQEDENIRTSVEQVREKELVNLLLKNYLQGQRDKLVVTDSEVDEKLKAEPKLDRERAAKMLQTTKVNNLLEQYYAQLRNKFHLKKLDDNFAEAARIHERLLLRPKEPRKVTWIQNKQVENELTPKEKDIILAEFDGGKVTLEDWLQTLSDIVPPRRPKDLNTPQGVDQLLDRALRMPIFVTEARLQGLDKDKNVLQKVREYEDNRLLYKVRAEHTKDINEPSQDEMLAYFNQNKEIFGNSAVVKTDHIWCENRKIAEIAKAELDAGKDFDLVKLKYSLQKRSKPFNTYPSSQGLFWKDLWQAELNETVGPVKGFYKDGIKWRIVKILEKKPGELKEYSEDMNNNIKWRIIAVRREAALAKYRKELLEKYPHKIYADRIKDIDPLDIP
jgi:peptidyl-prolyl cis-trans isomerase C